MKIGANKSLERDRIVDVFLRQEGHVSAADLFEAVRQQYPRIGRATVYPALQRMVAAGLAHKVDFGEGRRARGFVSIRPSPSGPHRRVASRSASSWGSTAGSRAHGRSPAAMRTRTRLSRYFVNADNNINISPGSPRAVRLALLVKF